MMKIVPENVFLLFFSQRERCGSERKIWVSEKILSLIKEKLMALIEKF